MHSVNNPLFKLILALIFSAICLSKALTCFAIDTRTFDASIKTFEERPQNFPLALILLTGATNIRFYELGGTYQLTYRLKADYPAKQSIAAISDELKKSDWRALPEHFLNPGLPSSHVSGWSYFEQTAKVSPHRQSTNGLQIGRTRMVTSYNMGLFISTIGPARRI